MHIGLSTSSMCFLIEIAALEQYKSVYAVDNPVISSPVAIIRTTSFSIYIDLVPPQRFVYPTLSFLMLSVHIHRP